MTRNAFWKDSLRQVRATLNRFLAILVITALGVAFFAGLRASGPDMRATALAYYDKLNFMDIRLLSAIGFDEDDVDAIKSTQGVSGVMPAYSYDVIVELPNENLTIRLNSLSEEPNTEDNINAPELIEGRMPESSGECLVDPRFITLSDYQIGDTVNLVSGTATLVSDALKTDAFQIVGIAESPLYISNERGSSDIGSGKTDAYVLVLADDFVLSAYTEIYVTIENEAGLSRFDDAYADLLEPVESALEDTGELRASVRYAEIKDDATEILDDARAELDDGWTEYNQNKADFDTQIADAQQQLDDGYAQYNQGLAEYESGLSVLGTAKENSETQLSQAEDQLVQGQAEYEKELGAYNDGKTLYNTLASALAAGDTPEALATINMLIDPLRAENVDLAAVLSAYVDNPDDAATVAIAQGAVGQFGSMLEQSKQQLDVVGGTLDEKSAELEQARLDAQSQLDESQQQLEEAKSQLDDLKETLDQNSDELDQSRIEGQEELAEAENKLGEAAQEIEDGAAQLAELEMPEWYVLDHDTNIGFVSYKEDAERIDALSVLFPLLFFLVAALVSMTSMTRLVESDRPYIGTLKALGYSNGKIVSRYLLYALAASSLGSVIGLIAGFNIFPRVIFNAYGVLYNLPPIEADFNLKFALISTVAAVSCATLPTWFVCVRALRGTSAEMMRPAAPNGGKRIFLERITPLWKMLNFSQKVAMRNLFRYKKRLFMTIFGVAGCTALMFAGFGLRDAITTVEPKQYGVIQLYDLQIDFEQDASAEEKQLLDEAVQNNADILSVSELFQGSVDILNDGQLKSTTLIVPEVPSEFADFVHFQNRKTQETLTLDDDSVIITERLAELFDLQVGDSFVLRDDDGKEATVQVGGVTENYLYHYIYMSPLLYRSVFGAEPVDNQMLCLLRDAAGDNSALATRLLEQPCVSSVTLTANVEASFENIVNSLHYVVWVLIISAAMLVFVVLFSLTTINLEERGRELATIKVLGFYNLELAAYIYRENSFLTLIGTILGLLLGVVLQRYIITTMETDVLMFSRDLLWQSFVYSAGLTVIFAVVVNLVMFRHIAKIDMVSSLKSVE